MAKQRMFKDSKDAIELLQKMDKSSSALCLLWDADSGKTIFLWKGVCIHEVAGLFEEKLSVVEDDELDKHIKELKEHKEKKILARVD